MDPSIFGLRFYRASVKRVDSDGVPTYLHGQIRSDCSDFHLIFEPIYQRLREKTLLVARSVVDDYASDLPRIWSGERAGIDAVSGAALDVLGQWMPEFQGGMILAYEDVPAQVVRGVDAWSFSVESKRKHARNRWKQGLHSLLHNNDGVYWEVYSTDFGLCETLIEAHRSRSALSMFWVDFFKDFPGSARNGLESVEL